jgi:hypothetical protein
MPGPANTVAATATFFSEAQSPSVVDVFVDAAQQQNVADAAVAPFDVPGIGLDAGDARHERVAELVGQHC